MNKTALGNFLAALRNEKGLTQEQLAEMLNINYKTISKWECGNSLPTLDTLTQLSQIYNVSLYEFTICQKINNPLISKNDIKKIINQKSIKRFLTIKIILLIILLIISTCTLFTYIYTINNYNQIKVYELVSEDKDVYLEGIYVETHNNYYLNINSIKYLDENQEFLNEIISSLEYELITNNKVKEKKNIQIENEIELKKALSSISMYISDVGSYPDMENVYLKIIYENSNSKTISKQFKIEFANQISNNKLFY